MRRALFESPDCRDTSRCGSRRCRRARAGLVATAPCRGTGSESRQGRKSPRGAAEGRTGSVALRARALPCAAPNGWRPRGPRPRSIRTSRRHARSVATWADLDCAANRRAPRRRATFNGLDRATSSYLGTTGAPPTPPRGQPGRGPPGDERLAVADEPRRRRDRPGPAQRLLRLRGERPFRPESLFRPPFGALLRCGAGAVRGAQSLRHLARSLEGLRPLRAVGAGGVLHLSHSGTPGR